MRFFRLIAHITRLYINYRRNCLTIAFFYLIYEKFILDKSTFLNLY